MEKWKQINRKAGIEGICKVTSSICNRWRLIACKGLLFVTVGLEIVVHPINGAANPAEERLTRDTRKQPSSPPIGTLWYNGDWIVGCEYGINFYGNGIGFHYNGVNTHVYDDFVVPSPGWHIIGVFCNSVFWTFLNTPDFQVLGAIWEIRQGVSNGNPGSLVASGFSYSPSVTETGRVADGCSFQAPHSSEYQILVSGLDVNLAPGSYWLNVTPIGTDNNDGDVSDALISATAGAECVGSPCGNDFNAFSNSPEFGEVWKPINGDFSMGVVGGCPVGSNCFLELISVTTVKLGFPILLPLSGKSGVEDRSGTPGGAYTAQMTFTNNVTSFSHVVSSCGRIASTSISGNVLTVNLSGVGAGCNGSDITISANDVMDDQGQNLGTACVSMGLLLGDVDGNRVVDSNDLAVVRTQLGQPTDANNLRSDVNSDGTISNADIQIVTRQLGTRLP
jgi:hypothetical protein